MSAAVTLSLLMVLGATSDGNTDSSDMDHEEIVVPPHVGEKLQEDFRKVAPITEHLSGLNKPRRRIEAKALGLLPSQLDDDQLRVVGPITQEELRRLLAAQKLQESLSKVVGDMKYARLYFGSPEKEPCCFGEWTFSKESGEWKRIFEYWRSH